MFRSLFIIIALFMGGVTANVATSAEVIKRVFNASDGLANASIKDIAFDDNGFAWLATESGLYRVSSTTIRRLDKVGFESILDDSLISNVITVDKHHLLVSSFKSAYLYNIADNHFTKLHVGSKVEDGIYSESTVSEPIVAVRTMSDGQIRLMTRSGEFFSLNLDDKSLTENDGFQLDPEYQWHDFFELPNQDVVLVAKSRIQIGTDTYIDWPQQFGNIGQAIHREDFLWVVTSVGLFKLELSVLAIKKIDGFDYKLKRVAVDHEGYLWLSGRDGLIRWHPEHTVRSHVNYKAELKQQANMEYVNDMVIDANGLIWLGGTGDGLALVAPPAKFVKQTYTTTSKYQLQKDMIWAVYYEPESLWLGSDGGLQHVDLINKSSTLIEPEQLMSHYSVYKIIPFDNTFLGVATTNGLFVVNKLTHETMRFHQWTGGKQSLEHEIVIDIYQDPVNANRFWVPSTKGLFYWDRGATDLKLMSFGDISTKKVWFNDIQRDALGRLWLAGENFGYFDQNEQFQLKVDRLNQLESNIEVSGILEVSPGVLWLSSIHKGIFEYDTQADTLVNLSDEWRVNCNSVYFMLQTATDHLVGCNNSVIKHNRKTGELNSYLNHDGFISDEFNEAATFYSPDEGVFIGTPDGAMLIDPDLLANRIVDNSIILESVSVFHDDNSIVELLPEDGFSVDPGAGMLSFQIASLDYLDLTPMSLQYRLVKEGDVKGNFYLIEGKSQINMANPQPGKYVLELQYKRNGIWTQEPFTFAFTVGQFWWQSNQFKSVSLLSLMLLVALVIGYRQRQVNNFKAVNAALLESDEHLYQALKASGSDLWRWQGENRKIYLDNRGGILGEQPHIINHIKDIPIHPEDVQHAKLAWQALINAEVDMIDVAFRYRDAAKGWRWFRVRGRANAKDAATGKLTQAAGIFTDVTEQVELQSEVSLLAEAFEHTSEGVMILDVNKRIKVSNAAANVILAANSSQLINTYFAELVVGNQSPLNIDRLFGDESYWSGERSLYCFNGEPCPVQLNISIMRNASGLPAHYVVVFSDITERKLHESHLKRLADSDNLTGLSNRSKFTQTLEQVTEAAAQSGEKLAVLFLDLDRFKHVNDSYGHSAGDALLVEAAKRVQSCLGPEHFLCRFGGDEFVALIRYVEDIDTVSHIAEQILAQFESTFNVNGREIYISTSLGISMWPDDTRSPEALIQNADQAMYHAKDEGSGEFRYYSAERNAQALYHLRLEADIRTTLETGGFELYYQPQIDILHGDSVVGMEALIRWNHPEDGFIRPDVFIAIAESCGLVVDIDRWVLKQACMDGARWLNSHNKDIYISVNISAIHFRQPDFIQHFKDVLQQTGMPASRISVEITEGVLMKELQIAKSHLAELKKMQVKVAIDDFGTGYSSLAYLSSFDVNTLKIDRSFLINIADNSADQAIVSSIIELARNLKLNVIAEGVETHEQLEQVFARGCYIIQGYYFSKPMPRPQCDDYLQKHIAIS